MTAPVESQAWSAAPPGVSAEGDACLLASVAEGGVLVLTMNLSRRKNALSDELRNGLRDALGAAMADTAIRSVVLTGSGGCFCAGGDIKGMGRPIPEATQRLEVLHDVIRMIALGPKPVVAAVEGVAYGGGWSLAACCDTVVAHASARFCASFGKVGLVPDMGIMWSLPQRVGPARARRLLQSGREVGAAEAVEIGAADVLTDDDPVACAIDEARALVPFAPLPATYLRAIISEHHGALSAVLAAERKAQQALFATRDHAEAREAFLEKRPPRFMGD